MVDLFKWYKERCNTDGVPNELQSKIITASCGHPASFIILLKLYHYCRPTVDSWKSTLQLQLEKYMNGTHFKIENALRERSQEDQACIRNLIGSADGLDTSLQKIGKVEKYLLDIGVLVQSDDKINFTSEIILRVCINSL
ncbi:1452_t:CDS:1 [Paraglomus occultum]|uniref:1452_t:CDS:1 n=1 Tax=Paraglomus occultum TaxID=144539 RepID=A0A9N9DRA1_9GLOM|nr:1452_t:CDS:1 [Paraglomus occultum]